jgi:hypothetical protein
MTPSKELQASIDIHKQFVEERSSMFRGYSILPYVPELMSLIRNSNISSCLDYGCGRGEAWELHNLKKLFDLKDLYLYDPTIAEFQNRPNNQVDLVICIDVMEHVPEHCVEEVLDDVAFFAKKAIFFNISTRPAAKVLPNGSNAHQTVRPREWWQEKINTMNKLVITYYSS